MKKLAVSLKHLIRVILSLNGIRLQFQYHVYFANDSHPIIYQKAGRDFSSLLLVALFHKYSLTLNFSSLEIHLKHFTKFSESVPVYLYDRLGPSWPLKFEFSKFPFLRLYSIRLTRHSVLINNSSNPLMIFMFRDGILLVYCCC